LLLVVWPVPFQHQTDVFFVHETTCEGRGTISPANGKRMAADTSAAAIDLAVA
jgi:hypothetical protein